MLEKSFWCLWRIFCYCDSFLERFHDFFGNGWRRRLSRSSSKLGDTGRIILNLLAKYFFLHHSCEHDNLSKMQLTSITLFPSIHLVMTLKRLSLKMTKSVEWVRRVYDDVLKGWSNIFRYVSDTALVEYRNENKLVV